VAGLEQRGLTVERLFLAGASQSASLLCAKKGDSRVVAKLADDPEQINRLTHEYCLLKSLSHVSVVRGLEWIDLHHGPAAWRQSGFVMEHCAGETLRRCFRMPLEGTEIQRAIFKKILSGVAYLHERRVSHRDLHSGNVMVDLVSLRVVIIDFGNARASGQGRRDRRFDASTLSSSSYHWEHGSGRSPDPGWPDPIYDTTPNPDVDLRSYSSLSDGTGTVNYILPPRDGCVDGLGSSAQRDLFAAGLLGVGLLRWAETTCLDIYDAEDGGSLDYKLTSSLHPQSGLELEAALRKLLHLVPKKRGTAQAALDSLPPAALWFRSDSTS
jgi:serine/threonine protein kinase